MVSPNPTTVGTGAGGVPPGPYDPYKALIEALPLPDDIFTLLKPAFGDTLEKDSASVADFGKNPFPHYRAVTAGGSIVLLHVGEEVAANPYGQASLSMIVPWFLPHSRAIYIFTEADSFAFDTDTLIHLWQQTQPTLKARFISLPLIQQLESELDPATRIQNIRGLLHLDDLLVHSLSLDQAIEKAYQQARLDLLDILKGLPKKLTRTDQEYLMRFLGEIAGGPPLSDSRKYLGNLLDKLGLDPRLAQYIRPAFTGQSYNDAEMFLSWLEERTYPDESLQGGFRRVLGYLLSLLVDQGGDGKKIALIIFKYKLVADDSVLKALVAKYP